MPGFNNNGMTAATSEYAMLDSMFAMDPVFPGLGNLDTLDQQFIPNWDNNNNNDTNHTQNIQSQSLPVHPTSFPNQTQNQNQNMNMLSTPTQFDAPGTPWSTWLQGTLQGQTQAPIPEDGLIGNGNGNGNGKQTMSSSEVYKKVVKP